LKDSELYAHRSDLNDAAMEKAERRIRSRIDNTLRKIDRDIGLNHMDPGDVQRLQYAAQQIKESAPRILLTIDRLKEEEHSCFRLFMRGLDDLTEGLVEAATRLAATPSGSNFFGKLERNKLTNPSRMGRDAKRSDRSEVLDRELGRLIDKGLGGESLRRALIKQFFDSKIEASLAQPSLSTVNTWARSYRRNGDWRPTK
jgi:hypothetical protein